MKEDPRLSPALDLLREEVDVVVPPDHERKIREALSFELAGGEDAPRDVAGDRTGEASGDVTRGPVDIAPGAGSAYGIKLAAALLIAAGAGGLGFVAGRAPTTPSATRATASPSAPPLVTTEPASVASDGSVSPRVPPAAPSPPARVTPPSLPSAVPAASSDQALAFDREQSLLERARAAIARHDPTAAARALEQATREFPVSKHAEEREYLQILMLRERGATSEAREAARAFAKAYPDSLLRGRVEAIAK